MATKKTSSKKAPPTKRSAGKKTPARKKAPAAKTAPARKTGTSPSRRPAAAKVSAEERYRLVREEAYYAAERDDFQGDALRYWVEAEQRVDARQGAAR